MYYFAYGSNMSLARMRARVPSAVSLGSFVLQGYLLKFHKTGMDGSAKCNALLTSKPDDAIYGVLFEIDERQKPILDKVEGLGHGYNEKMVCLRARNGSLLDAYTYVATNIDDNLRPYSWYLDHVLVGAREASLPEPYIRLNIESIQMIEDPDRERDARERAIYA